MKLECRCGQAFVYNPNAAGSTFACKFCKGTIRMPHRDQLSEEQLTELQQETARKRDKKEEAREKAEQKYTVPSWSADAAAAVERQKQDAAAELERQRQNVAFLKSRQQQTQEEAEARRTVTEEDAVGNRYGALQTLSAVYCVLAAITFIGAAVCALIGFGAIAKGEAAGAALLVVAVGAAISGIVTLAIAQAIKLAIDISDDVRASKLFLKRLAYKEQSTAPTKSPPPFAPENGPQ